MKVLLVDDEPEFIKILARAFQVYRPGYRLVSAASGEEALSVAGLEGPDLVVLDVMLPDLDGLEVCRRLRAERNVPVLLLSARGREDDIVQGFEAGADDYVTKPCSYRTLMARIDAVARRTHSPPAARPGVLSFGHLVVDLAKRQVWLRGQPVDLTPKEYRILEELARHSGEMVSHAVLLARIWGEDYRNEPQYLKGYVYRLRRKIEENPRRPHYILTHHRGGYCLWDNGTAARGADAYGVEPEIPAALP